MSAPVATMSEGEALYYVCCMILPFLASILVLYFNPGGALLLQKMQIAWSGFWSAVVFFVRRPQ